jgi:hypothetical protein
MYAALVQYHATFQQIEWQIEWTLVGMTATAQPPLRAGLLALLGLLEAEPQAQRGGGECQCRTSLLIDS